MDFAFRRLSEKQNRKSFLCDLCASAVNSVLSKTLLGSQFKPPFLGVVVDLLPPSWIPAYAGMTTVRYLTAETVKPFRVARA